MTAVSKPDNKAARLKTRLDRMTPSLVSVLGSTSEAERTNVLTMLYFTKRPELQRCSVESIAQCVLTIARDKLVVGRTAHIVAYGQDATVVNDWRGDIVLAIRAGRIVSCRPVIVNDTDDFDYEQGLEPRITHRPNWRQPGKPIAVYAVAKLPDGSYDVEVMSWDEVQAVRKRSRSGTSGPWATDPGEMAKKTVVKRLLKRHKDDASEDEDAPAATEKPAALPVGNTPLKAIGSGYDDPAITGEEMPTQEPGDAAE